MTNNDGIETNLLYKNDWFKIVERWYDGAMMSGIEIPDGVVVLPYETTPQGIITKLGIRYEMNPLKGTELVTTAITGGIDDKDETPWHGAVREMKEETGYVIEDPEKWIYLGKIDMHKVVRQVDYTYAVNVTGIKPIPNPSGDGTVNEQKSKFQMESLSTALEVNDAYILSMFMKLFLRLYGNSFTIK